MRGRGWGETKGEYRRRNCGDGGGGRQKGERHTCGAAGLERESGDGGRGCVWGGGGTAGVTTIDHRYSR